MSTKEASDRGSRDLCRPASSRTKSELSLKLAERRLIVAAEQRLGQVVQSDEVLDVGLALEQRLPQQLVGENVVATCVRADAHAASSGQSKGNQLLTSPVLVALLVAMPVRVIEQAAWLCHLLLQQTAGFGQRERRDFNEAGGGRSPTPDRRLLQKSRGQIQVPRDGHVAQPDSADALLELVRRGDD